MKSNEEIKNIIQNLFKKNLSLQPKEKVLIFTDKKKEELSDIAFLFSESAKELLAEVSLSIFPPRKGHGYEPPEEVWELAFGKHVLELLKKHNYFSKLISKKISEKDIDKISKIIEKYKNEAVDVVIALSFFSTSHTQFRRFLTNICGVRYCSMPLFEKSMFFSSLKEDFEDLKKRALFLKNKLKNASFITVRSTNGTFLRFSVTGREFLLDTGDLTQKGSFSNMPAGEVFIAPLEGTAEGKLVIEYAPTYKLKEPLTLYIEQGEIVLIEGEDDYKDILYRKLKDGKENNKLAEFGIGINSCATNFFNILEAEKILGTIHIAFGDNSSFGGKIKANFHEDYLVKDPTVEIYTFDKEHFFILYEGKPLF